MRLFIKLAALIIGIVLTLNGIALLFVSNINLGNFLTIGVGVIIVFFALGFKKIAKWLRALLIIGLSLTVIFSSFLIIYGKRDNVTYKENAIIVLGAAVHGKNPSLTLKRRLDKAAEYHAKNPDAIIVVSGGKGDGENITEAEAMRIYLVDKGINPDKIIKEEKATSTYENFVFSKTILDQYFGTGYTSVFITNEYHVLRSRLCAKRAGLTDVSHLHSNTNLSYLASGVLRECMATLKYVVFKN